MQYGTALPITAFPDLAQTRDYALALEEAGFGFTSTSGHVLGQPSGTNPQRPERQYVGPFNDPFVTFSYLAGATKRIKFVTAILIAPAWPTVLLAKQSAELALLAQDRFELGIGLSWNEAEYKALGQNFKNRGKRMEEQIEVLRLLWSQSFVTFAGRYHNIDNVGLNRSPVKIPVWIGSENGEAALRRVAKYADGWMSLGDPTPELPRLRRYMEEAGRDPNALRVRGPLPATDEGASAWISTAKRLQAAGITHLNIAAPPAMPPAEGLKRVIEARKAVADALG